mmetsp:Transcript_64366/g.134316  ORF Transcript_64366/g.134316 Transcript_64366/m.134316 type:complete len:202 (-) Transcript_64366:501-1106(-)
MSERKLHTFDVMDALAVARCFGQASASRTPGKSMPRSLSRSPRSVDSIRLQVVGYHVDMTSETRKDLTTLKPSSSTTRGSCFLSSDANRRNSPMSTVCRVFDSCSRNQVRAISRAFTASHASSTRFERFAAAEGGAPSTLSARHARFCASSASTIATISPKRAPGSTSSLCLGCAAHRLSISRTLTPTKSSVHRLHVGPGP